MRAARAAGEAQGGMIIREREPVNLESPFDRLDEFLTSNDLFYIRSHFKAPLLDAGSYELKVEGSVRHPFAIQLADLRDIPAVTRTATLQSAAHAPSSLSPHLTLRTC